MRRNPGSAGPGRTALAAMLRYADFRSAMPCRAGAGRRLAAATVLLACLLPQAAGADLRGRVEERAAVAGRSDAVLIAANPVLQRLQRERPALLRKVLRRLRSPLPAGRARKLERPQPAPTPEKAKEILGKNPDFGQLHRESPEAALDLIKLIREAARKQ